MFGHGRQGGDQSDPLRSHRAFDSGTTGASRVLATDSTDAQGVETERMAILRAICPSLVSDSAPSTCVKSFRGVDPWCCCCLPDTFRFEGRYFPGCAAGTSRLRLSADVYTCEAERTPHPRSSAWSGARACEAHPLPCTWTSARNQRRSGTRVSGRCRPRECRSERKIMVVRGDENAR